MKKKVKEAPETPEVPTNQQPGTRDIFLFGRLENEIALPVVKRLLKLNKSDPHKPINLYINSAGGNGYNADAIIAVMNSIQAKVNTICLGHALSGACEILASGTGERSSYEFATLMFHQTLWEADGDITNLEIQAAQGLRFREAQVELLHRCTGQEKPVIRKDIERDHYMSAAEAVEYGIIDRVIHHSRGHKKKGGAELHALPSALSVSGTESGKRVEKVAAKVSRRSATKGKTGRGRPKRKGV